MSDIFDTLDKRKQKDIFDTLEEDVFDQLESSKVQNSPSAGQIAGGIAAEVGIGIGSQALAVPTATATGLAVGATLAATGVGAPIAIPAAAITTGTVYTGLAFSGGYAGSIAAQKIEGVKDPSIGRAIFAGLLNIIPASGVAKGAINTTTRVGVPAMLAKGAVRGAAIGAGGVTAESLVDKNRTPTLGELAYGAGVGSVFGASFEGAFIGGRSLYNKLRNKTPNQIDTMIKSGEIIPADFNPITTNETTIKNTGILQDAIAETQTLASQSLEKEVATNPVSNFVQNVKEIGLKLKASIAPSKIVGKEIQDEAIAYQNNIDASVELGSKLRANIQKVVNEQEDPQSAIIAVNNYLDGKIEILPSSLKSLEGDLLLGREKIAELQAKFLSNIDLKISDVTPENRAIIAKSMDEGNYLTREFRFFTDEKYRPSDEAYRAAVDEISRENMGISVIAGEVVIPESARKKAITYINGLNAYKLSTIKNRNYLPSAVDGILRKKKDLGPALLNYLGEITEPGERIAGTLSRTARSVYRDSADNAIKNLLIDNKLAKTESSFGLQELMLKKYEKSGSGTYVEPHVQQAINNIYAGNNSSKDADYAANILNDLFNTGIAAAKFPKVLFNMSSYAVQAYGNIASLLATGVNPFIGAGRGLRIALSEFGPIERISSNPSARRALLLDMEEATKYGIKTGNVLMSDIRSNTQVGSIGGMLQKAISPFSKAYSAPDITGRYVSWKSNQRMLGLIFPEAGKDDIKKLAANVTNDTYQNYDRLSGFVKLLSKYGFAPQFSAFTAEFARNQWNQGVIIKQMLQGNFMSQDRLLGAANVANMRIEGAKRLASIIAVYGGTYGAVKAWNAMHGVNEAKDAALKETIIPDYDENKFLAISLNKDGKTGKYINPSYVIPHAIGLSALTKGLNGEPLNAVIDTVNNEFVGEGSFVMRSVFQAIFNYDVKKQQPISAETDKTKNTMERFKFFFEDAFKPGQAREADKLDKALGGKGNITISDVAKRQVGIRINPIDINRGAINKISRSVDNAKLSASKYNSARDYGDLPPDILETRYQQSNQSRKDALAKVIRHVSNLKILGKNDDEIYTILKDSNLGVKDILSVTDGVIPDLKRLERETPSDIWSEKISMLPIDQQNKAISEYRKIDRNIAEALHNKQKQEIQLKKRGVSPRDRLIMSLGISDGERSEYIFNQMMKSRNPDGVFNSFKKKNMIPNEVNKQIQLRQKSKYN